MEDFLVSRRHHNQKSETGDGAANVLGIIINENLLFTMSVGLAQKYQL
jgi:hypothetical protein